MRAMPTAQDALRIAAADIGYTEEPPGSNRTKFAAMAGHLTGYPWCATWVVAVMRRCGIKLPSESAYTPTMFNGFIAARTGKYGTAGIAPGDVVFFDFPDSKRGIQHVGLVLGVNQDGSLITVEGNTSAGDSGSQDNGGGVFRRIRSSRYVVGYGRPAYSKEIRPMFDPPISIAGVVVATLNAPGGGAWMLTDVGAVYAWGCPDFGAPNRHPEYWNLPGQKAARLEPLGNGYTVVDNGGRRYDYPAF